MKNPNFKTVIKILKPKIYVCQNKKRVKDPFYEKQGVKVHPIYRKKGISTTEIIERILDKYK